MKPVYSRCNPVTQEGDKFIRLDIFAEMYGVTKSNILVKKHDGALPKQLFKKFKNKLFINFTAIAKYHNFNNKITQESQNNYFTLTELLGKTSTVRLMTKLGAPRKFHNYSVYQGGDLFSIKDSSILCINVSLLRYEYWRYSTKLLRLVEKTKLTIEQELNDYILRNL